MSDIRDVLERTAPSADAPPSDETVDADVHRGRAALARRRTTRFSIAGVVAVAVVAGTVVVANNQGHSSVTITPRAGQHQHQTHQQRHQPGSVNGAPVRLVAYEGDQPEGFTVGQVPEGWFIEGSSPYSLTIAPEGDTGSPDAFVGKLVVMLQSKSMPQHLPDGDPVQVGGNPGVISNGPPADLLTYQDDAGHFVQVQAWTSALHWTDDQLISFADGVQVTANALPGVG
jgi:hypothetical protein